MVNPTTGNRWRNTLKDIPERMMEGINYHLPLVPGEKKVKRVEERLEVESRGSLWEKKRS